MPAVWTFLLTSWAFWIALAAAFNPLFLPGLLVPPLLGVMVPYALNFSGFLALPMALAATMSGVVYLALFRAYSLSRPIFQAIAVNGTFLLILVGASESRKNDVIMTLADKAGAECLQINSFVDSFRYLGSEPASHPHAAYRKGAEVQLWSYRNQNFFPVPEAISRNIELGRCR